jgi:hypothetical protein
MAISFLIFIKWLNRISDIIYFISFFSIVSFYLLLPADWMSNPFDRVVCGDFAGKK